MRTAWISLGVVSLCACQPAGTTGNLVLGGDELCAFVETTPDGQLYDCPETGPVLRPSAQTAPGVEEFNEVAGVLGAPAIPTLPRTEAEALCQAQTYARSRAQGAAEAAALDALGLPGNTLDIWRRSQTIANRIEGRSEGPTPPPGPPC